MKIALLLFCLFTATACSTKTRLTPEAQTLLTACGRLAPLEGGINWKLFDESRFQEFASLSRAFTNLKAGKPRQ